MVQEQQTTPVTTMRVISFPTQDRDLTELREKYSGLTITDEKSYKVVSAALSDVVSRRCAVTNRRRDLKRDIDVEAKRILALLEPIEKELRDTKQTEDGTREHFRQQKEAAKAARVKAIQNRIDEISAAVPPTPQSSDFLMQTIMDINKVVIGTEVFQEFTERAAQVKEETLSSLNTMLSDRIKWEEEEEKRKKEIAELNRLREENERLEAERNAREEAERQERYKEKVKLKAERDALEAEKVQIEADKRAEQERKERELAERQARIDHLQKIRFDQLLTVGYPATEDLGNMEQFDYEQLYNDKKTAHDLRQEVLRAEQEEKAEREREEFERIAKERAEREARERLEQEGAERKAKEKAEEIERKRQELLAPDKEKLVMLLGNIRIIKIPDVSSEEAKLIVLEVNDGLDGIMAYIDINVRDM